MAFLHVTVMNLPPELGLPKHYVAKQTRCVYRTRDASMIREQCDRNALEAMGFTSGIVNPCLFFQAGRDVTIVPMTKDQGPRTTDRNGVGLRQKLI